MEIGNGKIHLSCTDIHALLELAHCRPNDSNLHSHVAGIEADLRANGIDVPLTTDSSEAIVSYSISAELTTYTCAALHHAAEAEKIRRTNKPSNRTNSGNLTANFMYCTRAVFPRLTR